MTGAENRHYSLEAYLRLLEGRGANAENLERRQALLEILLPFLDKGAADSASFRSAMDEAMTEIDRQNWPFFLAIGREFYHFWIDDFKAIAALSKNGSFDVAPELPLIPQGSLRDMWAQLALEKFILSEKWPINAYRAALQIETQQKEVIEIRVNLAKLLLLQLRKTEGNDGKAYRLALESMLPVFVRQETAALFLEVGREFFHFWTGDPEAAKRINTSNMDNSHTQWLE